MTLQDLIRSVHGPGELIPALDLFLAKREGDYRASGWHPSDFCGICVRKRVLHSLIQMPSKWGEPDPGRQRIFDLGSALHALYQNEYFGDMGILWGKWKNLITQEIVWGFKPELGSRLWEYLEVPIVAPLIGYKPSKHGKLAAPSGKLRIVGHTDGLVKIDNIWAILEMKSINERGFGYLSAPVYNADLQGQIYGELIRDGHVPVPKGVNVPRPTKLIVFYIGKNNSKEKEFWQDLDKDVADEQLQKPLQYELAMTRRELPPREAECTNMLKPPAKKCDVGSHCFGSLSWGELERFGRNADSKVSW